MTSESLVSAVTVNWNGATHLDVCLPSLLAQSYHPLEIIVVDNASADDSATVASKFDVRWMPLKKNIGLAPALNRGAEAASGQFVLFLNNDMRFDEHFVERMVREITRDLDVFAVDALQYDWDGNNQVHLATRLAKKSRTDSNSYAVVPALYVYQESSDFPTPVVMASAANMLVRKSMFQSLGGFDERLPLGYEDVEICWRAWVHGWKTVFVPHAICWHHVGASSGSADGLRLGFRGVLGGRLLSATKLLPTRYAIWAWFATLGGLAADIGHFRWQRMRDRLTILSKYASFLPPLLRERRELYRAGHTSPSQQLERLLRLGIARAD
jgi:hypothetical protein